MAPFNGSFANTPPHKPVQQCPAMHSMLAAQTISPDGLNTKMNMILPSHATAGNEPQWPLYQQAKCP
jgi:hypothetical protein